MKKPTDKKKRLEELQGKYPTLCAQIGEHEYRRRLHECEIQKLVKLQRQVNEEAARLKASLESKAPASSTR